MMTEEWGAGKTVIADAREHAWRPETDGGSSETGNTSAVLHRDQSRLTSASSGARSPRSATVTEWKQNCHPVLPIVRSCVILQYDNVIGRQIRWGWQRPWPGRRALKEAGMTVMFPPKPPAPHLGARHRRGRVPTAVPASPVSRLIGATRDDDHFPAADALFGMMQWGPGTAARPPGDGYEYNDS
jgi:hypothetical protein